MLLAFYMTLYGLIVIPSVLYLIGYVLTRRRRPLITLIDIPLLGTPLASLMFSLKALLVIVMHPEVFDGRSLRSWWAIVDVGVLCLVVAVVWALLLSLRNAHRHVSLQPRSAAVPYVNCRCQQDQNL